MTTTVNTTDYEILIRFNENGKIGAMKRTLTVIKIDDHEPMVKANQPTPIDSLEELQGIVAAFTRSDWFVAPTDEELAK